jgi:signal transduction histidine kinase
MIVNEYKVIGKTAVALVLFCMVIAVIGGVGAYYLEDVRFHQMQFEGQWKEYQRVVAAEDILKGISTDISAWQAGRLPVDRLKSKAGQMKNVLSTWASDENDEPGQRHFPDYEEQEALLLDPARQAFLMLTKDIAALSDEPTDPSLGRLLRSLDRLQETSRPLHQFYFDKISSSLREAQKARHKAQRDGLLFVIIVVVFVFGGSIYGVKLLRRQARKLMEQERRMASVTLVQHLVHEIRNPLGIIKSAANVIERRSQGDVSVLAQDIASEVGRIDGLLTDLLLLRRGSDKPREHVEVSVLVARVVDLFTSKAEAADIRIVVHNQAAGVLLFCQADPVKQVVMNLLLNAIEASRPKDVIEITLKTVGNEYVLQVRDHGIGLDPRQKERIFDMMYTTKPYGFGIGLTVVKGIVEDHGGRIEVSSPPPSGSAFTVYFPVRS